LRAGDSKSFLLIIGAPKSATTTLARWLARHPDMVAAEYKEPRFFMDFAKYEWSGPGIGLFSKSMMRDEATYLQSYNSKPAASWAIDASTDYLWCEASPEKLRNGPPVSTPN
jgi:hypothetical protein